MIEFLGSLLNDLMPFIVVALVAGTALLAYAISGTPRACAHPGCTTNHWNLEKYCSHHTLDQDDERYEHNG